MLCAAVPLTGSCPTSSPPPLFVLHGCRHGLAATTSRLHGSCLATPLLSPFALALRGLQHHPALATSPHPLTRPCVACRVAPSVRPDNITPTLPPSSCTSIPGIPAPIPCTLLASDPAPPSFLLSPSGRALARPTCQPSRPLASSTRKSSFADFTYHY